MREISRLKKYEVADYYLLGYSYGEIEAETGVSHGSIANIVQELESGKLTVAGTSLDRVSDLAQRKAFLRSLVKKIVVEKSGVQWTEQRTFTLAFHLAT